jgi:hypothetical protein
MKKTRSKLPYENKRQNNISHGKNKLRKYFTMDDRKCWATHKALYLDEAETRIKCFGLSRARAK